MHTLKSILSYSLLIIIIAAAAAAFYYREQLEPHVMAGYDEARQLWDSRLKKYIGLDSEEPRQDDAAGKTVVEAGVAPVSTPHVLTPAPVPSPVQAAATEEVPVMEAPVVEAPKMTGEPGPLTASSSVASTTESPLPVMDEYQQTLSTYDSEPADVTPETASPVVADNVVPEQALPQPEPAVPEVEEQKEMDATVAPSGSDMQDSSPSALAPDEVQIASAAIASSPFDPVRIEAAPDVQPVLMEQQDEQAASEGDREVHTAETELLRSARHHFWLGEFEESVAAYNKLIEMDPEEANIYGELGNVYYAMGQWKKAGAAYFNAAERLLARGQIEPVYYLHYVIQGLDPELADKLKKRIQ